MFAGSVHQCTDYYATASAAEAVATSFRTVCAALSGKTLDGLCPAEGSIGSCVNSASSGPLAGSTQAALAQTYIYSTSASNTPASHRASCERNQGVYVGPDGTAPALPVGSDASACGGSDGGGNGTDIFSVAVYSNDEIVECTNYVGSVTQAQLDQLIASTGARAEPCPEAKAICSCSTAAGSGPLGTDATLVYYQSVANPAATCPRTDSACTAGYRNPKG